VTRLPFGLNVAEIIAALLGVVLLVGVVSYYFSSLKPEQDRLRGLEVQLAEQRRIMIESAKPVGAEGTSAEEMANKALDTLETFKTSHLKPFSSGRIDLIREINALAKKNSVTLTSGIDMGGGESNAEGEKTSEKKNTSKKKSDQLLNAFPSVSFHFTVFGQYANVRTLINDLERQKQFLVISSINLTNQEARANSRRSRGGGEAGVSGIMLTIEMSAYFQPAV
jgi:hypothetical protein